MSSSTTRLSARSSPASARCTTSPTRSATTTLASSAPPRRRVIAPRAPSRTGSTEARPRVLRHTRPEHHSKTTLEQFRSWIDCAKAHNYWLVIVYHEVIPDSAPRCQNVAADPDLCLGDFDTTVTSFQNQLDYISSAGLGPDVVTVQDALDKIDREMQGPVAGTVKITPAAPTTSATVTANPTGFSDPEGDALTYQYQWKVNDVAINGASGKTLTFPGRPRRRRRPDRG